MDKTLKKSKFIIEYPENTDLNEVINNPNVTLFGEKCDQTFTAFYVWEKFFCEFGESIHRFLELGCDNGGMSTYFVLWCYNIRAKYFGFDKRKRSVYGNTPVKRLVKLADRIKRCNIYVSQDVIADIIKRDGVSVVFTDCVDKPWEFNNFAPYLKLGDIFAIHDWGRAIKDDWVKDTIERIHPYRFLYEQERIELNTLTRFFLKE